MAKLQDLDVRRATKPGLHADGGGLFLSVTPRKTEDFSKSWVVRYTALDGRRREMGLGSYPEVSLAVARARAKAVRQQARDGVDPLAERDRLKKEAASAAARAISFSAFAREWIAAQVAADAELEKRKPGDGQWSNAKHRKQWLASLEQFAFPAFGAVPIGDVDRGMVLSALRPIWSSKHETARRVCQRIRAILQAAEEEGRRSAPNPATWSGIKRALPMVRPTVRHHPALPYDQVGAFVRDLRVQAGVAARALEFAILTAARTGEVIGAMWGEIDFDKRLWTVPKARMKARSEHIVPLSDGALKLLRSLEPEEKSEGGYIFPSSDGGALSNMAMLAALKRMKRSAITVHGFRSTFRDWAAERTNYPREIVEAALAHTLENKTEAAYRRSTLVEKRRRLMQAWSDYCDRQVAIGEGEVVRLKASGAPQ